MKDMITRSKARNDDITSILDKLQLQDQNERNSWSNGGSLRCAYSSRVPSKSSCSSSNGDFSSNVSEPLGFEFYSVEKNM